MIAEKLEDIVEAPEEKENKEGEENKEIMVENSQKEEQKREENAEEIGGEEGKKGEEGLETWIEKFVDNCSHSDLKEFIRFTLTKIEELSSQVKAQQKQIEEISKSASNGTSVSPLDKIPEVTSETLYVPKKTASLRGKRRAPTKPISELGEDLKVDRTEKKPVEEEKSRPKSMYGGMPGMGMAGMGMGGMMGELSSALRKKGSGESIAPLKVPLKRASDASGVKVPLKAAKEPIKASKEPAMPPAGFPLKLKKAPAKDVPKKEAN